MSRRVVFMSSLLCVLLGAAIALFALGSDFVRPDRIAVGEPPSGLPVEEIRFASEDGAELSGWLIARSGATAGVLLMHGTSQNRSAMASRVPFLFEAGYSVLLFDFRAHGESGGEMRTFGVRERLDAEAALALLKQRTGVQRTAVIGFSMGAAAVVLGDEPLSADAYVLEALYTTIEQAVRNRLRIYLGAPFEWMYPLLTLQIPPRTGVELDALRPVDAVTKLDSPVLIIAGQRDRRARLAENRALFDSLRADKQFWAVPDAGHVNFHAASRETYESRVLSFLRASLADAPRAD